MCGSFGAAIKIKLSVSWRNKTMISEPISGRFKARLLVLGVPELRTRSSPLRRIEAGTLDSKSLTSASFDEAMKPLIYPLM